MLVTVFGAAAHGANPDAAFARGADAAFWVAAGLLAVCVLIAATMRPARPATVTAPAVVRDDAETLTEQLADTVA